jgi:hypothetical protein
MRERGTKEDQRKQRKESEGEKIERKMSERGLQKESNKSDRREIMGES